MAMAVKETAQSRTTRPDMDATAEVGRAAVDTALKRGSLTWGCRGARHKKRQGDMVAISVRRRVDIETAA